jgi:hypothetical protein
MLVIVFVVNAVTLARAVIVLVPKAVIRARAVMVLVAMLKAGRTSTIAMS